MGPPVSTVIWSHLTGRGRAAAMLFRRWPEKEVQEFLVSQVIHESKFLLLSDEGLAASFGHTFAYQDNRG